MFSRIRLYKSNLARDFPMAGLDSTDCRILQTLPVDASQSLDYLLKLQLTDIASYDESYKRFIRCARCADVSAVFAMQKISRTTAIPMGGRIPN
jgi:hypothetical protein